MGEQGRLEAQRLLKRFQIAEGDRGASLFLLQTLE